MLVTVRPAERGARAADDQYFSMYGNCSCLQRGAGRTVSPLISVYVEMRMPWLG